MAFGNPLAFLTKEAHTKSSGIEKLLLAYFASPVITALWWSLPASLMMILTLASSPGDPAPSMSHILSVLPEALPEIWPIATLIVMVLSFAVTTPALIVGGIIAIVFNLLDKKHFYGFAWVATFCLAAFIAYEEGLKFELGWLFHILLIGCGAMTIAHYFWKFGVKNNHWLQNR